MAGYSFDQLVDIEQVRQLLESHHRLSGMAYGLFDPEENNLVAVGWQDICVRFHRAHAVTAARCRESDAFIKAHLHDSTGELLEYRCRNGMIDIAIPILIEGEHLATFFTGQFFYEDDPPERDFFVAQAGALGFDAEDYLQALDRVPLFSRDHIRGHVLFLHHTVQLLAETGLKNLQLVREMEERRQAELALRGSEKKYRRIVDTTSEGIWMLGPDTLGSFVNLRMGEMLGYPPEAFPGRPVTDFMFEEDAPDHLQKMENRRRGLSEHYERRFRRKDGKAIWTLAIANPILEDDGRFEGSFAMFTDITERKLAEEALQRLNRELHAISSCNQTLMRAEDEQTLLKEICRIICEEAGYRLAWVGYAEKDEAKTIRPVAWAGDDAGYIAQARLTWSDTERGRGPAGTSIRTGEVICLQDFTRSPEFTPWLADALERGYRSGVFLPLKDENARVFGVLLIYSADVNTITSEEVRLLEELTGDLAFGIAALRTRSERKRAEVALRSSEEKYRTLIQKIRAGVVVHGADTQVLTSNSMAQELLGLTEAQMLGKKAVDPDWQFIRENGTPAPPNEYPVNRVLSSREALTNLILGVHRPHNENDIWLLVNADPVIDPDGQITQVIVTFVDITKRILAEETVRVERGLFVGGPSVVFKWKAEEGWPVEYVSPNVVEQFGYTPEDLTSGKARPFGLLVHPDDLARVGEEVVRYGEQGAASFEQVYRIAHADGSYRWVDDFTTILRGRDGAITHYLGYLLDITGIKSAEESLRHLNRELRAISNCNQTLMRAVDEQTLLNDICHIVCDEAGYRMAWVGYAEHDEAKAIRPVAWAGAEDGYLAQAHLTWADTERGCGPAGTAIRTAVAACVQDFAKDPRGSPWRDNALLRGYRSCVSLPLMGEDAKPFGVLTIYSTAPNAFTRDELRLLDELAGDLAFGIVALRTRAERRWMEESLAKREREFRALAENSPDVIVRYDRECRRVYVNPAYERANHLSSREVLGTRPVELSTELAPMAAPFTQRLKEVLSTGVATQIDLQWTKDGQENCWFVRAIPELDTNGGVASVLTIWTDITSRKRLENALRESEQKFRSLAENSPENIFRYDQQCRAIYANHQIKTILAGSDESFLGKTPLERSPNGHFEGGVGEVENFQATLQRVISTGDMADVEMHVPDASGALRTHSVRFTAERDQEGHIVGALAFGRDITEKNRLEEQLRQSQKMEAVGQLAGGVAHDFNNILTAIIGFSNLAKMKMKPDDPQQPLIDHILASSDRAAHLTHSLLAFSRKQVLLPKPVELNGLVQGVEKLLARLIGEDIELSVKLAGQGLIVMADAGQIEQVLMNLATNARDAMPRGGTLAITTEAVTLGKDFVGAHGYGRAGKYVLITVSDTGTGMDEVTRGKIFEPFFTTKEQGKGTGLGLSIVYGIVKQHDGFINVYSEPGKGTAFRIYLPVIDKAAAEEHQDAAPPPSGGAETILLAEDDQDVRALTSAILRDHGYHVIEAVDGVDAVEKHRAHAKEVDLVILDVIMPRMSGRDAYDAMKTESQGLRALFLSGYTADFLNSKGFFEEGSLFLAKPMSPVELLTKVRGILDGGL